jgi:aminoglycoside 2'-N-acetyltransferase I
MSNEHETSQLIESGQNRKNLTISILIKQAKSLTKVELQEWSTLLREVFGNGEDEMEWADIDWNVLVKLGNKLVSQVDIIDRIAQVGYHKVRLGGIGGVGTLPEFRGRGFAGMALASAAIFMEKEMGVDFGFLFCSPEMVSFYSRLNWQVKDAPVYYDQPGRKVLLDGKAMILACIRNAWPDGEVDVSGYPW